MYIIFGAGVVIFGYALVYLLVTVISDGATGWLNNNIEGVSIALFLIYLVGILLVFREQKKEYGKISLLTPLISFPSFAQFFYFTIEGIKAVAKAHAIFSFFLFFGYFIWLLISGFATFVAQANCVFLPNLKNKYADVSEKLFALLVPIAVGIVGGLVNYIIL